MRCAFVSKETGLDFRSDGKPNSKFPVGFFSCSVKWNSQNRTGFSSKDGAWWSRRQWLRLFSWNRVSEVLNRSLSPDDCMSLQFSSVQSLSCVQLFETPLTEACQASLTITWPQNLLKLMSIVLVIPCSHIILYHPLLLLPSIFSSIRVFSNESVLPIRWPKYWSFSFSISPSNEY